MDLTDAVDRSPRRRGAVLAVSALLGVLLVAFVAVLATREPAEDRRRDSPLVGSVAPPLAGVTIAPAATAGEDFDIDRLRGQWVVVNFFATWCVPCIEEHPDLVEFSERHEATGDASVVSVVFADRAAQVAGFFEDNGGDWPVLDGQDVILDWAVAAVPESFLVAPDGVVVAKITGGVTVEGLDALLAEAQGA